MTSNKKTITPYDLFGNARDKLDHERYEELLASGILDRLFRGAIDKDAPESERGLTAREALQLAIQSQPSAVPPAPVVTPVPTVTPRRQRLPADTPTVAPAPAPKSSAKPRRGSKRKRKPRRTVRGNGLGCIYIFSFVFFAIVLLLAYGPPILLFFQWLKTW